MLTVDGYASLHRFYLAADNAVYERMLAQWNHIRDQWRDSFGEEGPTPDDKGPERSDYWLFNRHSAAMLLVYDVFRRQIAKSGKQVQVLRPDSARVGIPLSMLRPVQTLYEVKGEYSAYRSGLKTGTFYAPAPINGDEYLFGLDTLKLDFWPDMFLNKQVFHQADLSFPHVYKKVEKWITMVNWSSGTVDLTEMRAFVAATKHFTDGMKELNSIHCDPPAHMMRYLTHNNSRPFNLFAMLEPLENCSIIAPEEWLQDLETSEVVGGQLMSLADPPSSPREALLNLVDTSDVVTRQTSGQGRLSYSLECRTVSSIGTGRQSLKTVLNFANQEGNQDTVSKHCLDWLIAAGVTWLG